MLSKQRILVENVIRRCKIFRITKEIYRGKHKNYGRTWNLIAGLVNFRYVIPILKKTGYNMYYFIYRNGKEFRSRRTIL